MTQIEQQKTAFQQQKAGYLALEKELNELQAEKRQAENILAALENELNDSLQRAKDKLNLLNSLSADDYVELKSKDTGLTARIEYYQALIEEIDTKLYDKKTQIYQERERLFYIRGAVFSSLADELLNKLIENCKQDLENIYNFLYLSGKFKPNPLLNEKGTIEYQVTEFIFNSLFKVINKNTPIEPEYTLPNFIEAFKPKNPMRLHVEKYSETEPKGFQKLIHNLTSK